MEYLIHIGILVGVYTILAVSLDLLVGQTGQVSVAHAAFFGIGAYTSAILATQVSMPFFIGLGMGMILAAVSAAVYSLCALRLKDDYFVIGTFAWQVLLYSVMHNWIQVTRGPLGILGIPRPHIVGVPIDTHVAYALLTLLCVVGVMAVASRIAASPFGRALRAIREDENVAMSLGKDVTRLRITIFATSAGFAALAGSLYAHYVLFVDPTSFTIMESILILSMVIIGGAGSRWGPLLGAVVLVTIPEVLQALGFPRSVAAHLRQLLYGGLLVLFMVWRPQGLLGQHYFGKRRPMR